MVTERSREIIVYTVSVGDDYRKTVAPCLASHAARAWVFARRHLSNRRIVIQCDDDPLVDFYLLARADHLAVSNSSFGWWAGYLNASAPVIYGPTHKKWFSFLARDEPYRTTDDLYSSRFAEISF